MKENELKDYITYHGIVSGDKKRELLRICDIFCLLTTYPKEGQPISILEAMGNGMVVVATDHAGIPDQVTEGISGIVVSKNVDVRVIYERLLKLDEYSIIAVTNRVAAINKFSQARYIENMKICFNQVEGL